MILLDEKLLVFINQPLDLPEIVGGNPTITSETYRLKPKLALPVRRANVDMGGLVRFIRVEVETVRAYPQHRGHNLLLFPSKGPGPLAPFDYTRFTDLSPLIRRTSWLVFIEQNFGPHMLQ